MEHPSETGHWYRKDGTPAYTTTGKNGQERPTTLRDARKEGLVPSVTTILQSASRPGLESWKIDQTIMACLTMPRIENEPEEAYIRRLKEDSREQARKAAEKGTQIHAWVQQGFSGKAIPPEGIRYYESALKTIVGDCGEKNWHCEKSFATDRYGGKVDLYNEIYLIDAKSTDKDLKTIKTWPEHEMQLAAYNNGLEPKNVLRKCGILYIHTITAESKLLWLNFLDYDRGWKCFNNLLDFWWNKNGL